MEIAFSLSETPFTDAQVAEVNGLAGDVFKAVDEEDNAWRLTSLPDVSCFEAREGELLVGFKIGYAITSKRYYSWLGGVHAEFRGRGIARELMRRQHQWLRDRGYREVETRVFSDNEIMAHLNLSAGFEFVGAIETDGVARLIGRKRLTAGDAA
jgi:GNAT superfamily N-acetyltransferase